MTPVLTAKQMKGCDLYASEKLNISQNTLMENAANALFDACINSGRMKRTVILCGKGNNGGDGFYLASLLEKYGYAFDVIALYKSVYSGKVSHSICFDESPTDAVAAVKSATLIVDCVFGTGFKGETDKKLADIFCEANKKYVISCDVPSGIECDTGVSSEIHICADETVTMARQKPFMFLFPAKELAGRVIVADIGIPDEAIIAQNPHIETLDDGILQLIKTRPENSHKGTFGKLQAVCGSENMTGAAALCAYGALRSGVGLVVLATDEYVRKVLQGSVFEPVYADRLAQTGADAYVIGCGLGKDAGVILDYLNRDKPCVIDADALTYIANDANILKNRTATELIVTPHPLEMARLMRKTVEEIQADRLGCAEAFAKEYGVVAVLKGAHTVIASPDGKIRINTSGNSGLAKGGSGDVLAGLTGGLLAQGYDAFTAASIAVFSHGKAADIASAELSEYGVLPSDLPKYIATVLGGNN